MALPSLTFGAGAFSAKIYMQPGLASAVVPLTQAQMGSQDLSTAATAAVNITGITVPAQQLIVQEVGKFGYANSEASFAIAGARNGAKVATQSVPNSLVLTFPLNPSNANFQLLTVDANLGTVVRTFVIQWTAGGGTMNYAFNAFSSAIEFDFQTKAEAKSMITLVPQGGGQYGFSWV